MKQKRFKKLRKLNKKLFLIEQKLTQEAVKLDEVLQTRVANKNDLLEDYEIEANIDFYIKGVLDPIISIEESLKKISDEKEHYRWRFLDRVNHNEYLFRKKHPMRNDYHCWLFHVLYDHEHISWKVMCKIKDIILDIRVYHQYFKHKG